MTCVIEVIYDAGIVLLYSTKVCPAGTKVWPGTAGPEKVQRRKLKVTIGQIDSTHNEVWQQEALAATWDRTRNEMVIRGNIDSRKFASMVGKRKLAVEIEDIEPSRLVWRGYVGTTDFILFEAEAIDCCLIMLLDDWLGIVPQFSLS